MEDVFISPSPLSSLVRLQHYWLLPLPTLHLIRASFRYIVGFRTANLPHSVVVWAGLGTARRLVTSPPPALRSLPENRYDQHGLLLEDPHEGCQYVLAIIITISRILRVKLLGTSRPLSFPCLPIPPITLTFWFNMSCSSFCFVLNTHVPRELTHLLKTCTFKNILS